MSLATLCTTVQSTPFQVSCFKGQVNTVCYGYRRNRIFIFVHCIGRLLSRVAAVTTPTGIPQCPPTPTHHARPVNKPIQEQEPQLCVNKEQLSPAATVADLGIFLMQSKFLILWYQN